MLRTGCVLDKNDVDGPKVRVCAFEPVDGQPTTPLWRDVVVPERMLERYRSRRLSWRDFLQQYYEHLLDNKAAIVARGRRLNDEGAILLGEERNPQYSNRLLIVKFLKKFSDVTCAEEVFVDEEYTDVRADCAICHSKIPVSMNNLGCWVERDNGTVLWRFPVCPGCYYNWQERDKGDSLNTREEKAYIRRMMENRGLKVKVVDPNSGYKGVRKRG